MFRNRQEAGRALVQPLEPYRKREATVVIGLPRGGVVLSYEVAKALELPMDIICPRKISAPGNPEYAVGAVTETGEPMIHEALVQSLATPRDYLEGAIAEQRREAQQRVERYRVGRPPRDLNGKTILLIDDGLATGSTMHAAIAGCRAEGAGEIIVAVPVGPQDTVMELQDKVDQVICLEVPHPFYAVGQLYEDFPQTDDSEVLELMQKSK